MVAETSLRPKGLRRFLLAQLLQGVGDNALLALMLAWLSLAAHPAWWGAAWKWTLSLAYVVLAPGLLRWVGRGDTSRLLSLMAAVKVVAVVALVVGAPPWMAFWALGAAAALYAPAKYAWVTHRVRPQDLMRATGWIEGGMVLSIMLGLAFAALWVARAQTALAPQSFVWFGVCLCAGVYLVSAVLHRSLEPLSNQNGVRVATFDGKPQDETNKPDRVDAAAVRPSAGLASKLMRFCGVDDFVQDVLWLMRDVSTRTAMVMTSLLWGVAAVMQFAILEWSQSHLGLSLSHAFYLQALVGLGVVVGAVYSARTLLHQVHRLWPLSGLLALNLVALVGVSHWVLGSVLLLSLGSLSGCLVVPLNALLQHRGQRMCGAGRSMVVQGFAENLSVLVMLGAYTLAREHLPNVNGLLWGTAFVVMAVAAALVGPSRVWPRAWRKIGRLL